jgi:hypothetical protein
MDTMSTEKAYERVQKAIGSSINLLQLASAERMINLFRNMHSRPDLIEKLNYQYLLKASELHFEEWNKNEENNANAA